MKKSWAAAGASAFVLATGISVAPAYADHYIAGDMHNHTTCNDGNWSVQTMVTASLGTFGLDWMGDVGHGGAYVRDCRFDDFEGDGPTTGQGAYFENTVGLGAFKGDVANSTSNGGGKSHRAMWEWQIIEDMHYPLTVQTAQSLGKTVVFKGTEWNTPGHEHTDTTTLFGQTPWKKGKAGAGNATAVAEFEYRFDRSDTDTSGGGNGRWPGKDNTNNSGTAGHEIKSMAALNWMQTNYPLGSIALPTHIERAGVFRPTANGGWNIEHLRDWNNAAPQVAFGMESMPGHQAASSRGEYAANFCGTGCDSVGVTTYGGTGIYAAKIGGLWDAMIGEGRNFFTYASSDFHQRGSFKATERFSNADFFPGEYEKTYVPSKKGTVRPQFVLDGLRSGNAYYTQGDLIGSDLTFTANVVGKGAGAAKTMGETLIVKKGQDVEITLTVTDPAGTNNSPYTFSNPSLKQIGVDQPLNQPVLDHIDLIGGAVTGLVAPGSPNYTVAANPSTQIMASYNASNWTEAGTTRTIKYVIHNVQNSQYVRARGTNLPVNTPNETDAQGNPLNDPPASAAVINCDDAACPAHMSNVGGVKKSSFDVAAWSDLWFYANPIFIRVQTDAPFKVENEAKVAKNLRAAKSN
jgi:hypothetical protein